MACVPAGPSRSSLTPGETGASERRHLDPEPHGFGLQEGRETEPSILRAQVISKAGETSTC